MADTLKTLKFVQGAIASRTLQPEMKHFVIQDGMVRSFNGIVSLCSPVDFAIACAPLAKPMVQAITNCTSEVDLAMTGANRLRISSGKFKAFIDCTDIETMPTQEPSGEIFDIDGEVLMRALTKIAPFTGNSEQHPWTNGVLLRNQSAFATNNKCMVEYWLGYQLPFSINLPMAAIKEMIRIGESPNHVMADTNSITFKYDDGGWIQTQLYSTEWPDLSKVLDNPSPTTEMPPDFFTGLESIRQFIEAAGHVYLRNGKLHTSTDDELGASFAVDGLAADCAFSFDQIKLLEDVAKRMDFAQFPKAMPFVGDQIRGVILGLTR